MSNSNANQLINWKTNAWKDPNMVAWYSGRMVENTSTIPLKNALEADLCLKYALPGKLLDVGIGTGRGSLPLARRGFQVTGIDSSQAMLDECRRLAGDTPLALQLGDVENLPVADADFDTLISLNVVVHFPHWRELIGKWKRVMRPGGRMIFDVHSLDNCRAVHGANVSEESLLQMAAMEAGGHSRYMLRVAVEDMVAEVDRVGLAVVDIVPYGAFLGGGNTNYLFEAMENRFDWRRLLSWLAADADFHAFALFLEQELVARLTSLTTGRYMVVLENCADPQANLAWLERNREINRVLAETNSFASLAPFLNAPKDFLARFNKLLSGSLRSAVFLFRLCREFEKRGGALDYGSFLSEVNLRRFEAWRAQYRADRESLEMVQTWHQLPEMKAALDFQGVSLGAGMEYFLMEQVLSDYMGIFTGAKS